MSKIVTVDVTQLFQLAQGFLDTRIRTIRVVGLANRARASVARFLGQIAHLLTLTAFRLLPRSEAYKLPTDLVRPALVEMATAPLPDRSVDQPGSNGWTGPAYASLSVRSPTRTLLDDDMADMTRGFGVPKANKK